MKLLLCVLALCAVVRASEVAHLARDFFGVRAVGVLVLALGNATEKTNVFRILARDGRFQVSISQNSASLYHLLDIRQRTNVGVLLKGAQEAGNRFKTKEAFWFNDSYHWLSVEDGEDLSVGRWPLRLDSEVYRARHTFVKNISSMENGGYSITYGIRHENASEQYKDEARGPARWALDEMFRSDKESVVSWPFATWSWTDGLASDDVIAFGGNPLEERRSQLRRATHYRHPVVRTAVFQEHYADPDTLKHITELHPDIVTAHLNLLSTVSLIAVDNTLERFNATVKAKGYLKSGELDPPSSGIFSGALGAVQRGSVDLVSTGFLMSFGRLRHFSFTLNTYELRIVGLFLAESTLGSVDALITPFDWSAWMALIFLASLGTLLYRRFRQAEEDPITWSESFISSFGSFTGQGFASTGEWFSGRLMLLVFDVLFMLIQVYYGSAIVKFLLRPPPPAVRNVEELLHSHYPVALHEWWLIIREFETAKSGIERQLYEKKIGPPHGLGYMSSEALESVLSKPLHVIVGAQETVYKSTTNFNERQACRLHEVDVLTSNHIAPVMNRQCPFKETVYAGLLLQRERGVLQRAVIKWAQPRARCSGDGAHGEGEPIALDPVEPVICVILFGFVVAPLVACIERVLGAPNRYR